MPLRLSPPLHLEDYFFRQGLCLDRLTTSQGHTLYLQRSNGHLVMFGGRAGAYSPDELWQDWGRQQSWFRWHKNFSSVLILRYLRADPLERNTFERWLTLGACTWNAKLLRDEDIDRAGWPWSAMHRKSIGIRLWVEGDTFPTSSMRMTQRALLALESVYLQPQFDPCEPVEYLMALRLLLSDMERQSIDETLPPAQGQQGRTTRI